MSMVIRILNFYPRPPRGGRQTRCAPYPMPGKFLSTPSARRATLQHGQLEHGRLISIHALREEGDQSLQKFWNVITLFLSTPSARRATDKMTVPPVGYYISIHALREEGDARPLVSSQMSVFLSTPSARRATKYPLRGEKWLISIHALREEGDWMTRRPVTLSTLFLSTPSARRATSAAVVGWLRATISIHALREEGDSVPQRLGVVNFGFLSTPSARRATSWSRSVPSGSLHFYPRPPRGGRLACTWPCC